VSVEEEVPTGDETAAQSKEEPKKELKEEPKSAPVDKIKDAKARTVIIGYCGQEARLRIIHLETAKEQWKKLERAYQLLGRQQLSSALQRFYGYIPTPNASVNSIVTILPQARMNIFNIDANQKPTDESTIVILFNSLRSINPAYGPITLQLELQDISTFETIVGHLKEAERRHARSIVLTDVLYVPQIRRNLIFIIRLQDKEITVETTVSPVRKALIIKC